MSSEDCNYPNNPTYAVKDVEELVQFLHPSQRLDVRKIAMHHTLGITDSPQGILVIFKVKDMLKSIFRLTSDKNPEIALKAVLCLMNMTGEVEYATECYKLSYEIGFALVETAFKSVLDSVSPLADAWAIVLSNMTRDKTLTLNILDILEKEEETIVKLVKVFTTISFNNLCEVNYLGHFFCNLTQTKRGRDVIFYSPHDFFKDFLPFTYFNESHVRRCGIVGLLRNVCFEVEYHKKMVATDDVLCSILYPIIGPEEFDEEDNAKFPFELQYMYDSKEREDDSSLRKMLLDCLLLLCSTKDIRELLRSKGVYEILREYHKWEMKSGRNKECIVACENVIDILIKTEEEIGLDNYQDVKLPDGAAKDFEEEYKQYLSALQKQFNEQNIKKGVAQEISPEIAPDISETLKMQQEESFQIELQEENERLELAEQEKESEIVEEESDWEDDYGDRLKEEEAEYRRREEEGDDTEEEEEE